MSSTDTDDDRTLEEALAAAHASLSARGARFFAIAPDAAEPTYFERPRRARMTPADFESPRASSPSECVESAAAIWRREGVSELAAVVPALARIAREAEESPSESEREIPDLIYAMF